MAFLSEDTPAYGVAVQAAPGIRRLVANNPSHFTYHGTNTWLIDEPEGVVVMDPGPEDANHLAAILSACEGRVLRIVLTHTHPDHAGGVTALKAATGAPCHGWAEPWWKELTPDLTIADGARIGSLTALHTPGHASDHLCFAHAGGGLFSGDHVMSWNTSIVSPPDGDMGAYIEGLRLLLAREDHTYFCGHGPVLPNPQPMVRAMLIHRLNREAAVLGALGAAPRSAGEIVAELYAGVDRSLHRAAERTVLAHLFKLRAEGRAQENETGWLAASGRPGLCPGAPLGPSAPDPLL